MQVLKANNGKSKLVSKLLACTNSLCIVYYNEPINFIESIYIDSSKYTLDELLKYL